MDLDHYYTIPYFTIPNAKSKFHTTALIHSHDMTHMLHVVLAPMNQRHNYPWCHSTPAPSLWPRLRSMQWSSEIDRQVGPHWWKLPNHQREADQKDLEQLRQGGNDHQYLTHSQCHMRTLTLLQKNPTAHCRLPISDYSPWLSTGSWSPSPTPKFDVISYIILYNYISYYHSVFSIQYHCNCHYHIKSNHIIQSAWPAYNYKSRAIGPSAIHPSARPTLTAPKWPFHDASRNRLVMGWDNRCWAGVKLRHCRWQSRPTTRPSTWEHMATPQRRQGSIDQKWNLYSISIDNLECAALQSCISAAASLGFKCGATSLSLIFAIDWTFWSKKLCAPHASSGARAPL